MTPHRQGDVRRDRRRWPLWTDLSLRTTLLLFALALVTVPGVVFAFMAFSSARAALEREIGIQLHQTAERGADAVLEALDRARSDARSWAGQDLMRDLLVRDLDKRVSRFLQTVRDGERPYLEILCADGHGEVVAASSGEWIGRRVAHWRAMRTVDPGGEVLSGPELVPEVGRRVLQLGVPIADPDAPGSRIGQLILVYDWAGIETMLDDVRGKLVPLGKRVAALIVDGDGTVIGGVPFDGSVLDRSAVTSQRWATAPAAGYETRVIRDASGARTSVLLGAAAVPTPPDGWTILFIERSAEALRAVRRIRTQWVVIIVGILSTGLAVATVLARQVMRPLDEMTRATSQIAARPEQDLPLLPVRSRNEVGQLTESFNAMTVALKRSQEEALSAAKFAFAGELAAMVAHEVRTPLSVLRSSAQMLADLPARTAADRGELVETIVAEVDRVEHVVTGLIELARPVEHRPEAACLGEVLSRAADFAAAHAEQQGIRITCEIADPAPRAFCDPEQIYQVVLNLLVNALQATPRGGSVWLRTLPEQAGTVGFEVADDGPGLPQALAQRIFEPFVTGREGGTGLGLAFVDRVVKAHRGAVTVRSAAGHGAAFVVRLPTAGGRA
jgi:signal transduction histidine kinase